MRIDEEKKWKGWDKERPGAIQNKLTVHPAALEYHLRSPEIEGFFPERSLSTAGKEKIKKQYTFSEKKKNKYGIFIHLFVF